MPASISADPVPQAKVLRWSDAKGGYSRRICGNRDEVPGDGCIGAERGHAPAPGGPGVAEGFLGGEGFRANIHNDAFVSGRAQGNVPRQ